LWCEFRGLLDCKATFHLGDDRGWIDHHAVEHLGGEFPRRLVCWFCDDFGDAFSVPTNSKTLDTDLKENFELRMAHVREHILSDDLTLDQMRPDFYMVEHLYRHNLMDGISYKSAMHYTEVPESFRIP
ncbi:hypothetical protein B0T16DRAFT_297714, partial [Cercophora newfieldiana]